MSFQQHIDYVFEPNDIVELRLIGKDKPVKKLWQCAKDLAELEAVLQKYNAEGFNIYIGVNPRKEFNKSGDDNVVMARYLFADFDHIEPEDCGRWEFVSDIIYQAGIDQPDLKVFSGHGIHCYWKLPEPLLDLNRWRNIQAGLSQKLGSDPSIKNPERIMRAPGFKNLKGKPVDCFIF